MVGAGSQDAPAIAPDFSNPPTLARLLLGRRLDRRPSWMPCEAGGFEIGGIAGCILAGAFHRRPVVIDGFISTAGALVAHSLCPTAVDYVFAGHCSQEAGHRRMLEHLGLEPILDLRMRLGEGTGAALAMGVIEGAVRTFKEVLTFEDAGVSNKPL